MTISNKKEISAEHIEQIFIRDDIHHYFWDNVNFCILAIDKDGYIIDVNDFFLNKLGYKKKEVAGILYTSLLHPDDIEASLEIERSNLPNETFVKGKSHFENRYRTKEGKYKTLRWHEGDGMFFDNKNYYICYAKIV